MSKRKILTVILFACTLILCFSGCRGNEFNSRAAEMDTYTITMSYHPDEHLLSAVMQFRYKNRNDNVIDELKFNLHANAYRDGAVFSPVNQDDMAAAYPNGFSYGKINVSAVKINGKDCSFEICGSDCNILSIKPENQLFQGDSVEIEINYTIEIANIRHRLGYHNNIVNLAHFYPVLCYMQNGQFVEYPYYANGDPFVSNMSNFSVTLLLPESYSVAHSGECVEKITENGTSTYLFEGKCIRDFALCISEDFSVKSIQCEDTLIEYYYISDGTPDDTLALITACFSYFNQAFGEYPYSYYCVAQTELCFAGMEFSNMVYVANDLSKESYYRVIIHETAHQWWYGLVGNNQVENAWLDEGLAEYSVIMFYEAFPEYGNGLEMIKNSYKRYKLFYDVITNYNKNFDTSLTRSIPEYPDGQSYVCMNYLKAQLLFDSLNSTMGDKKFNSAIKRYFETAKYTVTSPETLIGCFEKEYGASLQKWFECWLGNEAVIG